MNSFEDLFNCVVDYCKEVGGIGDVALKLWIKNLKPVNLEGNKAVFMVDSDFQRGVVLSNYEQLLKNGFKETLGFDVEIEIRIPDDDNKISSPVDLDSLDEKQQELEKSYEYAKYDYTFDTFIVGSSNEFAYAACTAVAKGGGMVYNPLFIYGPSGLGKTHLITATANEMKRNNDKLKIVYVTGETFASEIINAIHTKSTAAFHDKYRSADVLLVDDIQFIAGKDSTQEEFFHTFNALYQDGKQIVLTSDRPPKAIKTLEDRIRSRFESGLIADISTPDFETRMAILQDKVKYEPIALSNEVLEFIAMNIKTNIRELEGALINVLAHYKLKQDAPMTVDYVKRILAQKLNELNRRELDIDLIKETVSKYFKIEVSDLSSKNRANSIAYPRQVAMYLCRNMLDCALGNIGSAFEKDHTTIMHGVKKIDEKIKTTESVKQDIENIKKMLED